MAGVEMQSTFKINSVMWISSLYPPEQGVTRRIADDLHDFFQGIGLGHEFEYPVSAVDFLSLLDHIAEQAKAGYRPIIHIDMHGNKGTGLHIAATGENVPWDVLIEKFRSINIATANNLCVVSLACYGFYQLKPKLVLDQPAAFYMLAAPDDIVTAGCVVDAVLPFYNDLFTSLDFIGAFERNLKDKLSLFHCVQLFFVSMGRYLKYIRGKGKQERVESLVSEINSKRPMSQTQMQAVRKTLKDGLRPTQELLDKYANIYLMGRPLSFCMEDIVKFVDDAAR